VRIAFGTLSGRGLRVPLEWHIYAQVVDEPQRRTLVSASSLDQDTRKDSRAGRQPWRPPKVIGKKIG